MSDAGTRDLLDRWHGGDRAALEELLRQDLPWVERQVRRRLGKILRARAETQDYVQQAVVEFLEYGPRFVIANRRHFRGLLARIAENVLRGAHDHFTAHRRAIHRERPLAGSSVLALCVDSQSPDRPSQAAAAAERRDEVRLALELIDAGDRDLILWHDWDELSFVEVGARLEISADAARMRYYSALARLGGTVSKIRERRMDELLGDSLEDDAGNEARDDG